MMTVYLWIYRWKDERQGIQFDIPYVIEKLQKWFGDVEVDTTDYFAARTGFFAGRIEERGDDSGAIGAKGISEKDATELGPGYRFVIKSVNAVGSIERYRIGFRTENDWTEEERNKIEGFLHAFGINKPKWTIKE